jgi:hypothetical protein
LSKCIECKNSIKKGDKYKCLKRGSFIFEVEKEKKCILYLENRGV